MSKTPDYTWFLNSFILDNFQMNKNIGGMLKNLQTMQTRMATLQEELGNAEYVGSAANGMVEVTITGKGELRRVIYDPAVMTEDRETLQDLVVVAAKVAYNLKEAEAKRKLATMSSGLLPLGLKIPGLA